MSVIHIHDEAKHFGQFVNDQDRTLVAFCKERGGNLTEWEAARARVFRRVGSWYVKRPTFDVNGRELHWVRRTGAVYERIQP